MSSPTTHQTEFQWHTPQTTRVKTLIYDVNWSYRRIESEIGIPKSTAWDLANGSSARRIPNSDRKETRGRKRKMSREDVARADQLLETAGFDGKTLTWEMLAYELNLDISSWTLKREMNQLDWHRCIACRKGWCSPSHSEQRVKWAHNALFLRPKPEDWDNVRSSDESHAGFASEGKVYVTRKSGTRACASCIQHVASESKEERNAKRKHFWAAVGYNFKSDLVFYEVSGNKNGKLTHQVYIDKILESVIKPWLADVKINKYQFTFEEDGDSGHGIGKSNIVRTWKQNNGLDYYFNCPGSSDLASIENCWQGPKAWMKRVPHWDNETTESLLVEGWEDHVSQKFINNHMRSMPRRLQDVIDLEDQMTGW